MKRWIRESYGLLLRRRARVQQQSFGFLAAHVSRHAASFQIHISTRLESWEQGCNTIGAF